MGFNSNNLTNEDIRSLCENKTCWICPLYNIQNSCPIANPSQVYPSLSSKRGSKNGKEVENV